MIFVVCRDAGADAIPVCTATNLGRAKSLARTLCEMRGCAYHVRLFRVHEGVWVEGASAWPKDGPAEDPAVEVTRT